MAKRLGILLCVLGAVAFLVPGAARADDELVYVALGDSFTSGPLVLPHDTTHSPQDCGQSTRNYPHLAAEALGLDLIDVSCGSARIEHLYEPQSGLPMGGTNAPQFGALGPEVDIVTLGISGNDVGFVGFALDCVRLTPGEEPCTPDDAGPDDEMGQKIAATQAILQQAIRDIRSLAPNAAVYVVNYPTSLPDDGVGCYPYLPIYDEDMPYLVAKYKQMNAMVAAAAAGEGATLIDIYTPSIGHDACQVPSVAWVNGMVVVPPSYPAHPNEFGLAASGGFVADVLAADIESGRIGFVTPTSDPTSGPDDGSDGPPDDAVTGASDTPAVVGASGATTVLAKTGPSLAPPLRWIFAGALAGAGLLLRRRAAAQR